MGSIALAVPDGELPSVYYINRFTVSSEAFLSSIVLIGHRALRTPTRPLPPAAIHRGVLRALVKRMFSVMRKADGVGLAANQIGLPYRLFVMESRDNPRYPGKGTVLAGAFLNPRILARKGRKILDWEGCLSIPGYRGLTPRSEKVVFEAMGMDGRKVRREAKGFEARIIQHECDHLDGLFYVDRMPRASIFSRNFKVARDVPVSRISGPGIPGVSTMSKRATDMKQWVHADEFEQHSGIPRPAKKP